MNVRKEAGDEKGFEAIVDIYFFSYKMIIKKLKGKFVDLRKKIYAKIIRLLVLLFRVKLSNAQLKFSSAFYSRVNFNSHFFANQFTNLTLNSNNSNNNNKDNISSSNYCLSNLVIIFLCSYYFFIIWKKIIWGDKSMFIKFSFSQGLYVYFLHIHVKCHNTFFSQIKRRLEMRIICIFV